MRGGIFDVTGPFMKILVTAYTALVLLAMFFAINQYNLIFLENSRDRDNLVIGNAVLSLDCLVENSEGQPVKTLLSEEKINKEIALNPLRDKNINCLSNYDKQVYIEIYGESGFLYGIGNSTVCKTPFPSRCEKIDSATVTSFPAALNRTSKIEPVNLKIFIDSIINPNPVSSLLRASILSPNNGTIFNYNAMVTFFASASGGTVPYTYSWTSSIDGNIGITKTFSKNDLSIGDHTITLTVTDALGATDTDEITISVSSTPSTLTTEIISPHNADTFDYTDSIDFNCLVGGGTVPYTYSWTSNMNGNIGNTKSFSKSGLVGQDNLITLTVTDSTGKIGTDQITIHITGFPLTASIESPLDGTTFAIGNSVDFSGLAIGGTPPYTYDWTSTRDGYIGDLQTFSKNDLSLGDHIINFVVTDSLGAIATDQITIHINSGGLLTTSITSPTDGDIFSFGDTLIFFGSTNGGTAPYTYSWTSSINGNIGNNNWVEKFNLNMGDHLITLTVTDSLGAIATDEITIHIGRNDEALAASIESPLDEATFNSGNSITFNGIAVGGTPPYVSYSWGSNRDGFLSGLQTFNKNTLSVGDHVIRLTVTDSTGKKGTDETITHIINIIVT